MNMTVFILSILFILSKWIPSSPDILNQFDRIDRIDRMKSKNRNMTVFILSILFILSKWN